MNFVRKIDVRRSMGTGLLLLFVGLVTGCTRPPTPPPPEPTPGERQDYVIGIPDLLRIHVWRSPELTVEVPVRSDGKISVPLVDDVQAEGLTTEELKEVLTEALSDFVTAPDVTVIVQQINSHTVTVVGAVGRSGQLPLVRQTRVLEAIATMGGFTVWAKKNRVKIFRRAGAGLMEYQFNYGAFSAGKAPGSNILLQPGDTVVVPD
jgi:polysaccharide export outer membrane protein